MQAVVVARLPCVRMNTRTTPDSDDDTVAIVVARLPCVRMVNPSYTQDRKGAAKEREMQSEEARVSNEIILEAI